VRSPLTFNPIRLNLGNIEREDVGVTKVVEIRRGDGGPIKPEVVTTRGLHSAVMMREIEPGEHYEMVISTSPPWPSGRLSDYIRITTGVPESPDASYLVTGTIPPRLSTSPRFFTLPVERAEETTDSVELVWSKNLPGKVTTVVTTIEGGSVNVKEEGSKQTIVLTVPAGSAGVQSRGREQVVVHIEDEKEPTLRIPVLFRDRPYNRSTWQGRHPAVKPEDATTHGPPAAPAAATEVKPGQPTEAKARQNPESKPGK